MFRLSKVVKLPSGKAERRMYMALRERKRYALVISTAPSEEPLKAAVKPAGGVEDCWDYHYSAGSRNHGRKVTGGVP